MSWMKDWVIVGSALLAISQVIFSIAVVFRRGQTQYLPGSTVEIEKKEDDKEKS